MDEHVDNSGYFLNRWEQEICPTAVNLKSHLAFQISVDPVLGKGEGEASHTHKTETKRYQF